MYLPVVSFVSSRRTYCGRILSNELVFTPDFEVPFGFSSSSLSSLSLSSTICQKTGKKTDLPFVSDDVQGSGKQLLSWVSDGIGLLQGC